MASLEATKAVASVFAFAVVQLLTVISALPIDSLDAALSPGSPDVTSNASTQNLSLWYLHLPKTGTSFQTTLVNTMCKVPEGMSLHSNLNDGGHGACHYMETHNSTCREGAFSYFPCGHIPMPLNVSAELGVTMIRDPLQRIASGYFAKPERFHDCRSLQSEHNCTDGSCDGDELDAAGNFVANSAISPVAYGKCVQRCYANMLIGAPCGAKVPTNTALAIARLKNFSFVGLTDYWMLSICLWHKKMGGQPLPIELANNRPGSIGQNGTTRKYDAQALFGKWKPPIDMQIYKAGADKFWAEIEAHKITEKSCEDDFRRNGWRPDGASEH
eukprot:gnl/TRDRNA2_/TRDRNA2_184418_c0_seq1.p1 gnl/TRDRNA2_/TRDRNA2_184418_c0~~gnl/TRDRNA2_/TRDRNA2_184418_c0_seq1.p1  ORF type:complete len:329 (+),score=34.45 gnl/TRDRNA2_/TRDRNA2_184418_c0_seq1:95-1081(+)